MKKVFIFVFIMFVSFAALSSLASAHMTESESVSQTSTLNSENFSEMESIMTKMMDSANLSEEESQKMISHMEDHHNHHSLSSWDSAGMSMMNGWGHGGSFMSWFWFVGMIIWLLVGVFLIIFLMKKSLK
ncbi:MAG: hypothetical protein WD471_01175 [Candidatus Paceibacterota bacterium]